MGCHPTNSLGIVMMRKPKHSPPNWALHFFRWFCHSEFREDIEGDLLEKFEYRVEQKGLTKAKWLFVNDVLHLIRPALIKDINLSLNQIYHPQIRFVLQLFASLIFLPFFIYGSGNIWRSFDIFKETKK